MPILFARNLSNEIHGTAFFHFILFERKMVNRLPV